MRPTRPGPHDLNPARFPAIHAQNVQPLRRRRRAGGCLWSGPWRGLRLAMIGVNPGTGVPIPSCGSSTQGRKDSSRRTNSPVACCSQVPAGETDNVRFTCVVNGACRGPPGPTPIPRAATGAHRRGAPRGVARSGIPDHPQPDPARSGHDAASGPAALRRRSSPVWPEAADTLRVLKAGNSTRNEFPRDMAAAIRSLGARVSAGRRLFGRSARSLHVIRSRLAPLWQ